MLRPFNWLRARVPLRHWAWIHAFLALGLGWGHSIVLFPPSAFDDVVDQSLIFRMGILSALGAIVSVIGLMLTRSLHPRRVHKGLWIELVGVALLAGGPLQYLGLQIGFLVDDISESGGFDQRYALSWFAYSMVAFVAIRFFIIIPELIESANKARVQERSLR